MANGTTVKEPIKSIRVRPSEAAKIIGIGYEECLKLIHRGLFTVFDNKKRGILRRIWLLRDEVELYAREGEEALKEHRVKKRKTKR